MRVQRQPCFVSLTKMSLHNETFQFKLNSQSFLVFSFFLADQPDNFTRNIIKK